jgi:hypothetical protein
MGARIGRSAFGRQGKVSHPQLYRHITLVGSSLKTLDRAGPRGEADLTAGDGKGFEIGS